ncbi:hypothetical protein TrCOL_g11010 [Triparma columacea]|uniref:Enoyl-CoA hydratase/isomerase family protein n=1 Tax=Triparma columacea TaxID=722753 RepID=A0A9W7G216_9STRA|nr:hypothetical protein TrCOL_g11010 [Triparma columacea]
MNSPETRNSLSPSMMLELGEAVDKSKESPFVILTGAEGSFCSGANIALAAKELMSTEGGVAMNTLMMEVTGNLSGLDAVSFSAIDGAAFGGGAELATATDFRVLGGGSRSRVKFVQSLMGVTTGWGGGGRLVELVGRKEALQLLLTHKEINDDRHPFIDWQAPEGVSALAYTEQLIDSILNKVDPQVVKSTKQMTGGGGALERDIFASLWGGKAHREAFERALR